LASLVAGRCFDLGVGSHFHLFVQLRLGLRGLGRCRGCPGRCGGRGRGHCGGFGASQLLLFARRGGGALAAATAAATFATRLPGLRLLVLLLLFLRLLRGLLGGRGLVGLVLALGAALLATLLVATTIAL